MTIKRDNIYDLSGTIGVGYTFKGSKFYFDLEDYDLIKGYSWYADTKGYLCSRTRGTKNRTFIQMHRLLLQAQPNECIDHRNGVKNNNCRYNLRPATKLQNNQNHKIFRNNTSGITGVYYSHRNSINKWTACIGVNNKNIRQSFETKGEAIAQRLIYEKQYFGEFVYTGVI